MKPRYGPEQLSQVEDAISPSHVICFQTITDLSRSLCRINAGALRSAASLLLVAKWVFNSNQGLQSSTRHSSLQANRNVNRCKKDWDGEEPISIRQNSNHDPADSSRGRVSFKTVVAQFKTVPPRFDIVLATFNTEGS